MKLVQKLAIALFTTLAATTSVFARAIDTADHAIEVKDKLQNLVFEIEGVNSIGVTGCNPRTGARDVSGPFVHCVSIGTETHESYNTVIQLFPRGKKIDGVYVTVKYAGRIVVQ